MKYKDLDYLDRTALLIDTYEKDGADHDTAVDTVEQMSNEEVDQTLRKTFGFTDEAETT